MRLSTARGIPTTVEACMAVVRDELSRRLGGIALPPELDAAVTREVERLWVNPIKTFIPLLATRAVWESLAFRGSEPAAELTSTVTRAQSRRDADMLPRTERDTLAYDRNDDLVLNGRDTVRFDDRETLRPD